jgi:hypothetical protein
LRQVVTFRLDPGLLAKARHSAQRENRTLTNFVETLIKQAVEGPVSGSDQTTASDSGKPPPPTALRKDLETSID